MFFPHHFETLNEINLNSIYLGNQEGGNRKIIPTLKREQFQTLDIISFLLASHYVALFLSIFLTIWKYRIQLKMIS